MIDDFKMPLLHAIDNTWTGHNCKLQFENKNYTCEFVSLAAFDSWPAEGWQENQMENSSQIVDEKL